LGGIREGGGWVLKLLFGKTESGRGPRRSLYIKWYSKWPNSSDCIEEITHRERIVK